MLLLSVCYRVELSVNRPCFPHPATMSVSRSSDKRRKKKKDYEDLFHTITVTVPGVREKDCLLSEFRYLPIHRYHLCAAAVIELPGDWDRGERGKKRISTSF